MRKQLSIRVACTLRSMGYRGRTTTVGKGPLHSSKALLQRVVLACQCVHLCLELAAVLFPQRDLQGGDIHWCQKCQSL